MRIKSNTFLGYIIITVLYCVLAIVLDFSYALVSFIMSILLLIILLFGYNRDEPLTSINNLYITFFYFIGIFGRYIFILIYPELFQEFSAIHIEDSVAYHIKTQVFLLLTFISFILGKLICKKNKHRFHRIRNDDSIVLKNQKILLVSYFFLAVVVFVYRYRFAISSVSNAYNTFDYFFTILTQYLKFVAYYYLYNYIKHKKFIFLFIYLVYAFPQVFLSLINAWKGTLIQEIIIVMMVLYVAHVKIRLRTYVLSAFAVLIVFFVITNYRTVLIHGGSLDISYSGFSDYVRDEFIHQISNRFEEYDLVYYTINSPIDRIEFIRENSSTIIVAFFKSIIPRFLWPDKGVVRNLPVLIKQYFFGHTGIYSNSNVTYLGESFLSYGWIGSIFVSFLYGIICNYLEPTESSKFAITRYVLIASCILYFYEGNISGKIISLILTLIIVTFVKKICFTNSVLSNDQ